MIVEYILYINPLQTANLMYRNRIIQWHYIFSQERRVVGPTFKNEVVKTKWGNFRVSMDFSLQSIPTQMADLGILPSF